MRDEIELVPFDTEFVDYYFDSHNDFMRKTGMNRSTFYNRIYGGWWVRFTHKDSLLISFDLLRYKESFQVSA